MSTPTTITIDGTEYIRKQDASTPAGPPTPHRIVVADRGWVFVGACEQGEDGSITISNAKCIRYWGTDEKRPGLGWLAVNGPTEKTKLDPNGTVRVPSHAVMNTMDTVAGLWPK